MSKSNALAALIVLFSLLGVFNRQAAAQIRITEWMYSGANGEFVEFTNVGTSPIDMTNWSYSDTDASPGDLDFGTTFGIVAGGESVILTETAPAAFRTAWGLSASVKVLGSNINSNLGRNDQINLYDNLGALVDNLIFGDDTNVPGSIRTQNKTGITLPSNYGANNALGWFFSASGDAYGSHASTGGDIGNPGIAAVPEPMSVGLIGVASLIVTLRRRRA